MKKPTLEQNVFVVQRAVWSSHLDDYWWYTPIMRSERSAEGAQWNSSKSFYLFLFIFCIYAAFSLWDTGILSNEALWLWTAFRTAWFMLPRVSFWQIQLQPATCTLSLRCDQKCTFEPVQSSISALMTAIGGARGVTLGWSFSPWKRSMQTAWCWHCSMLELCSSESHALGWVWTTAHLQWCTFKLNLWPQPFAGLLACGRYSEKPSLSQGVEKPALDSYALPLSSDLN